MFVDIDAAAVGHDEFTGFASRFGDTFRKAFGQQVMGEDLTARLGLRLGQGLSGSSPAVGQGARLGDLGGAVTAKRFQAGVEVGRLATQSVFRQQDGQLRALGGGAGFGGLEQHMGQARRHRQLRHHAAMLRQVAGGVKRAQGLQQLDRLVHGRLGRMVEQGQALG